MTVESATYISQLNPAYPGAADPRSEGDDHIRLFKTVLQAQFPNLGAAAVTPTAAQLNYVTGVTSAIQTQLDAKAPLAAGGLVLLSTQSASSSSSIDFTASIDGTYDEYELHIINAIPNGGGGTFSLYTSANAGSSWDSTSGDYDWQVHSGKTATSTSGNGSTTATSMVMSNDNTEFTAAWGGMCAVVRFFDPAGTAHHKRFQWAACHATSTTRGNLAVINGTGSRAATAAINGVRFKHSGSVINTGKFKLYGLRKS